MPISPARKIAFDVLRRVATEDAYAADLLYMQLAGGAKRADAALATELTLGVLRRQRLLDFLLERYLDRRGDELDIEVLLALRLGMYQLRYLDRVPQHAAINESVELVKRARKSSAAGMVNAVLRHGAAQARVDGRDLDRLVSERLAGGVSDAERLGIVHSHPTWLVERWLRSWGKERTKALLEANNRPAPLTCAVLDEEASERIAESLRKSGFGVTPGRWLRGALHISGGYAASSESYRAGEINFQDEASQMVAHLVDASASHSVLDLCAAPGGKTILLARTAGVDGWVVAADLREHRLRAMREQLTRTRAKNVRPLALDATRPLPFSEPFDRILIDAPCSGTGTLSRNPEIRWRLKPGDLEIAHGSQTAMLRNALAAGAQSRGGATRVVYSTCSLEPEENGRVVAEALSETREWHVTSGQAALRPHLRQAEAAEELFGAEGFFRTFPPEHGTDGFFAAAMERN
jgi:16S rRNA (cytosine967-C5)-methyltransferase